jgi:hypothetical protein
VVEVEDYDNKSKKVFSKGDIILWVIRHSKSLIDQIPNNKMYYIVAYLQGAAIPNETPNIETIETMHEWESGGGYRFSGTTEQLFNELMGDW